MDLLREIRKLRNLPRLRSDHLIDKLQLESNFGLTFVEEYFIRGLLHTMCMRQIYSGKDKVVCNTKNVVEVPRHPNLLLLCGSTSINFNNWNS